MEEGRDVWWDRELEYVDANCPPAPHDSEHPLYLLYTSGSTGKPKGILHTTGGYLVNVYCTTKYVFDIRDEDIFWCTADVGWVTGHSYIVYGPLSNGATVVMFAIPILGASAIRSPAPIWLRIAAICGALVSLSAIFFTVYPIIDVPSPLSFALKIIAVTAIANAVGVAIYVAGKKRQRG